jgi:tRNA (guanine-N7-)-methyltransferase
MRLRNVRNAKEIINNSKYVVLNPNEYKGNWSKLFNNTNPIYIEIGMGKGNFIINNALTYPDINFIGIEKYDSVIVKAVEKINDEYIPNLRLIRMDALNIENIFYKEISRIYLTFSDPWPKEKHARRRLTSDIFLNLYENIFVDKKEIFMKTDNQSLYEYSKNSLTHHDYNVNYYIYNKDNIPTNNIMTEYEEKFLNNGQSIYGIKAFK